jgi:hypothetical protein
VRCLKQARPGEDLEKIPVVGIIASKLLPPPIHIDTSLDCSLDLLEASMRISIGAPDLLIYGCNHYFNELDLLLHKGFAFEHASVARDERLEIKFRRSFQCGDLLDGKTASQVGYRRIHQIAGNRDRR